MHQCMANRDAARVTFCGAARLRSTMPHVTPRRPAILSVCADAVAACVGPVAILALTASAALAAPCGGDHTLAIGVVRPPAGSSKGFGAMPLNSLTPAAPDILKAPRRSLAHTPA